MFTNTSTRCIGERPRIRGPIKPDDFIPRGMLLQIQFVFSTKTSTSCFFNRIQYSENVLQNTE